jgi:DUF971 family protein
MCVDAAKSSLFMRNHPQPLLVQVVGQELAIAWNDGTEAYVPLDVLRRACPCAVCQGEADVMGRVDRPEVKIGEAGYVLRGFRSIGGYAIQPQWGDGHDTGLYSYGYLQGLGRLMAGGADAETV